MFVSLASAQQIFELQQARTGMRLDCVSGENGFMLELYHDGNYISCRVGSESVRLVYSWSGFELVVRHPQNEAEFVRDLSDLCDKYMSGKFHVHDDVHDSLYELNGERSVELGKYDKLIFAVTTGDIRMQVTRNVWAGIEYYHMRVERDGQLVKKKVAMTPAAIDQNPNPLMQFKTKFDQMRNLYDALCDKAEAMRVKVMRIEAETGEI